MVSSRSPRSGGLVECTVVHSPLRPVREDDVLPDRGSDGGQSVLVQPRHNWVKRPVRMASIPNLDLSVERLNKSGYNASPPFLQLVSRKPLTTTVCVLGDGRVAAVTDGKVQIWEVDGGSVDARATDGDGMKGKVSLEPMTLEQREAVVSVCETSDGRLCTGAKNGTLRLWSDIKLKPTQHGMHSTSAVTDGGSEESSPPPPPPSSGSLYRMFKSARAPRKKIFEDAETVLTGHGAAVGALCPLRDRRLASGDDDGVILVWDIPQPETGRTTSGEIFDLRGPHKSINQLAVVPAIRGSTLIRLASCCHDAVCLWEVPASRHFEPDEDEGGEVEQTTTRIESCLTLGQGGATILCVLGSSIPVLATNDTKSEPGVFHIFDLRHRLYDVRQSTMVSSSYSLQYHTSTITALCSLGDGRLVSASMNGKLLVHDVLPALVVEGSDVSPRILPRHQRRGGAAITSLCLLHDGRLASAAEDGTVVISWPSSTVEGDEGAVAAATPESTVVELLSEREPIKKLSVLNDGRLACICARKVFIRRVDHPSVNLLFSCFKLADVEELIERIIFPPGLSDDDPCFRDIVDDLQSILGAIYWLLVAKAVPFVTARSSVPLAVQAYEAIANGISQQRDLRRMESLCNGALIDHVRKLAMDEGLFKQIGNHNLPIAVVDGLAASRVFRSVIQVRYTYLGPRDVFLFEAAMFTCLFACYSLLAYRQLAAVHPGYLGQKIALVVGLLLVFYFSVREYFQVRHLRHHERAQKRSERSSLEGDEFDDDRSLAGDSSPTDLPGSQRSLATKHSMVSRRLVHEIRHTKKWRDKIFDCLSKLGLPRAWVEDLWNWIDVGSFACAYGVFIKTAISWIRRGHPPKFDDPSELSNSDSHYFNLVVVGTLFLWLKVLSYMRGISTGFACFVQMLARITSDLKHFILLMGVMFVAMAHVLYLRLSSRTSDSFGFADDEAENEFNSFTSALQSLYILAFTGEFDERQYPRHADKLYLDLFIFLIMVLMLNVLIAIVEDSYHHAKAHSTKYFWRTRLYFVHETSTVFGDLVQWNEPSEEDVERILKDQVLYPKELASLQDHKLAKLQRQLVLHDAQMRSQMAQIGASQAEFAAELERVRKLLVDFTEAHNASLLSSASPLTSDHQRKRSFSYTSLDGLDQADGLLHPPPLPPERQQSHVSEEAAVVEVEGPYEGKSADEEDDVVLFAQDGGLRGSTGSNLPPSSPSSAFSSRHPHSVSTELSGVFRY